MHRVLFLFILAAVSFPFRGDAGEGTPITPGKDYVFVVSQTIFKNAEFSDVNATGKVLADHMKRSNNWFNDVNVVIVSDLKDLKTKLGSQFDVAIVSAQEYVEMRKNLPIEAFAVNQSRGKVGYDYLLLVNQNDNIGSLKQLSHESIRIFGSRDQSVSGLWIEKLLRQGKLPKKETFFSAVSFDQKSMNVVLPVFLKKTKACVIGAAAFDAMREMNPQLGKSLKIIEQSANIISVVAVVNRGHADRKSQDQMTNAVLQMHGTAFGRQLTTLFNFEQMVPFKPEYIQSYLDLLH